MKKSSVVVYFQAVRFYHKLFQIEMPVLSHPHLKAVLLGISNQPGHVSVSKPAFRVEDFDRLFSVVCEKIDVHLLVWTAVLFMFRTLLRVSHVTDSYHTLLR